MRGEVSRLEELRRRADELWGDVQLALGRHDLIVDSLARAVAEEPLREHRWEQLMMALYRCGRQAEALRAFQDARRVLTDELGIEPSPTLRALEQAVLVQDPDLNAPPRARPQRPGTTCLPCSPDWSARRRRGRNAQALEAPPGHGHRHGGVRQDTPGLAVADRLVDRFDDGVWFVDLTARERRRRGDPYRRFGSERVTSTAPATPSRSYRPSCATQVLVVLDNCEHVPPTSSQWSVRCSRRVPVCACWRLLASSSVRSGRASSRCRPSRRPRPMSQSRSHVVARGPAIPRTGRRCGASFDRTPDQLTTVGELCRFLEGVPLAIELAAMWTAVLPPSEILELLGNRLLLMATDESLPERQRALRTTIEWSYTLLSDTERLAFRRLSVFPAGFTLGGAAAVIAGDPDATETVIGPIARLVGSSLVRTYGLQVPARYRMLEAIREFAADQLDRSGEADHTRAHQLDYFVALARNSRRDEFFGPPNSETMAALDAEHDNVREALDRLIASRDGEQAGLLRRRVPTGPARTVGEGQQWLTTPRAPQTHARSAGPSIHCARRHPPRASRRADEPSRQSRSAETTKRRISWPPPHVSLARTRAAREFPDASCVRRGKADRGAPGEPMDRYDLAVYDSLALVLDGDRVEAHKGLLQGAAAVLDLGDESLAARLSCMQATSD
jgi:predicted ATPase